ncbi:hypothetical protein BIW11_13189 [Tropilaelaps mercedesae]|uniref:Uncharacterized protein n=1 Tax=Tropilaelaps mercedesae TaxID=418985 RepID=A0A1V9X3M7_9ACAR|nr:hypothetical protein BIW11_13189 [Tropilaelaps mercedesae]
MLEESTVHGTLSVFDKQVLSGPTQLHLRPRLKSCFCVAKQTIKMWTSPAPTTLDFPRPLAYNKRRKSFDFSVFRRVPMATARNGDPKKRVFHYAHE